MNRIMNKVLRVAMLMVAMLCVNSAISSNKLERVQPAAMGIAPEQLVLMYDSLMSSPLTEIHHVMVLVDGKVVGELHPAPFKAEYRHTLYSVSKTFAAVAVGLAVDDGLLSVDDKLIKFFPELEDKITDEKVKDITLHHVLTMQSGFKTEGGMRNKQQHWVEYYLTRPLAAVPGTRYSYDSIETYLLSAVVQKVTGKTILELLNERVFYPMGVKDAEWELCPDGIVTGGWGIYLSAETQAKFGQLLLDKGCWDGKQLVSQEWLKQMMSAHVIREANDYGYQIWLCEYPGAWRADGAFGQYIIVVPEKDMVVVLNQCSRSKGWPERSNIWHTVVKNCKNCAIDVHPDAIKALRDYEANAQLPVLDGKNKSDIANKYNNATFELAKNKLGWKSVKLRFADNEVIMDVTENNGTKSSIEMGYKEWITSQLGGYPHYSITAQNRFSGITGPFYTGSCYAWQNENLRAKIHYANWVTSIDVTFRFAGDNVILTVSENYPSKPFDISGKKK